MRTFVAIATVTLALGLVSRPLQGQVHAGDTTALRTIHMADAQTGWAVLIEPSAATPLARTTDGGTHWTDVTPFNSSGKKIWVDHITALSGDVAWVIPNGSSADLQVKEIFRTTDGGHSWGRSSVPGRTITSGSLISFISPREGWFLAHGDMFSITGRHGEEWVYIYQSTDGGETWFAAGSKCVPPSEPRRSEDELPRITGPTSIAFLNSRTGWVTGNAVFTPNLLYLYVTHDCGHSWQQQNAPLPRELSLRWETDGPPPKFFTSRDGILPVVFSHK